MRRAAISSAPKPSSRSAASQRYRRSRTATPKRASSSRTSTQAIASAHWSSCRARPTSSPATRSSRSGRGRARCRSPLWTRRTSRSSSARPTAATRRRRWASWSRRLRRRLERTSGCGASSDSSSANRTAKRPTNMPPMAIQTKPKYHRVLLKLSGEALLGGRQYGISPEYTRYVAEEIKKIHADVILMGKNAVDGVYDADPKLVRGAKKFEELRHRDLLDKSLGVMDATAAALAEERDIPIIVFDISAPDAMVRAAMGEHVGTLVHTS